MQCAYCKKVDNPVNLMGLPEGWVSVGYTLLVENNTDAGMSIDKNVFCSSDHAFNFIKAKLLDLGLTPDDKSDSITPA